MNKKNVFLGLLLIALAFGLWGFYPQKNDLSEKVKIALRQVGNQLLLFNKDSTSLVLPIKKVNENTYKISFEKELRFEPSTLVLTIKSNFKKLTISSNYRVEVIQCLDNEVAYSYEINIDKEKTIIPCAGRFLLEKCYIIKIEFLDKKVYQNRLLFYFFIPIIIGFLYLIFFNKKTHKTNENENEKHTVLGAFIFYPEQNKLVKKAKEIALSKKECELLAIFIANANQVIKREELTKRVWEDNGVIVGRSLDTYISKLRKKLQEDSSIKLINIHGIGYKLEVKK